MFGGSKSKYEVVKAFGIFGTTSHESWHQLAGVVLALASEGLESSGSPHHVKTSYVGGPPPLKSRAYLYRVPLQQLI